LEELKTACARNAAGSRVLEEEGEEDLGFGSMALGSGEKGELFFVFAFVFFLFCTVSERERERVIWTERIA
jgi:hypothetical protein